MNLPDDPKAIESLFRASEDRFDKVFNLSPAMIAISTAETGQHYAVNQAWLETMGFAREEVIGRTASDMNVWPSPEDRERFIDAFNDAGRSIRDYEVQLRTKSGETRTFLIAASEIEYDGANRLLLVFNDITERKRAEEQLQKTLADLEHKVKERTRAARQAEAELLESEHRLEESNRMLHLVLDAIPVRVFWKDKDLRYLGCNRTFAMDAGFTSARQIVGKTDHDMPWQDQVELYQTDDRKVIEQGQARLNYEEPQTTPEGDTIWLRTSKIPLRSVEGDIIGVLGMYEDITYAKQSETALRVAKEQAETANQAKSSFLSSMSHELRTPLNAILGFAQLLEYDPQHPLEPQQMESIEHIKSGGKHLLSLINEILDLAKIESGLIDFDTEPVRTSSLLEDILPIAKTLADKRGISLHTPALTHGDVTIFVDYVRTKQVLLNLLSNAVKYNRERGEVTLDCEIRGGNLRISVGDTGFGIPDAKIKELFQPFARLGAEETAIEGTGIGLTITKEIVERMGGDIGVDSVVGIGSTFWVELPLSDVQKDGAAHEEKAGEDFLKGRVEDAGFDGTVLYVEDNAANMLFMESVFERFANLRLITATNAEDGIEKAKCESPDLLILDVSLPGMDGTDAVRQLRQDADFAEKPIIALSANAMQMHIDAGLEAGFDAYLTKPLDISLLMKELEKVFGKVVVEA